MWTVFSLNPTLLFTVLYEDLREVYLKVLEILVLIMVLVLIFQESVILAHSDLIFSAAQFRWLELMRFSQFL